MLGLVCDLAKAASRLAAISSLDGCPVIDTLEGGRDGGGTTPSWGKDDTAVAVGKVAGAAEPILLPEPGNASATGIAVCDNDDDDDDENPVTFPWPGN